MNWSNKKIGYASHSKNLDAPGDRRRFIFYAKEKNIQFEIADTRCIYDIVYLTYGCDLSAWVDYKKRNPSVKIIFELIDSYLLQKQNILTILKGPIRYFLRYESNLYLNYKSVLIEIIRISDAVVCSTELQKNDILKYNKNIHISLDYFSLDILSYKKNNYKTNSTFKLVWEGQSFWVANLISLNNVFKKIDYNFEIKIITDKKASYYLGLRKKLVKNILKNLKCKFEFIEWNRETVSYIISDCDLAIIPIDTSDSFSNNKPENKLLFFWEIGIPVLTSDTPAYKRVMDIVGLEYYCSSDLEWKNKIEKFMKSDEFYKKKHIAAAREYLNNNHTKDLILKKWDLIFNSLENKV
jgi:hypothetical protein